MILDKLLKKQIEHKGNKDSNLKSIVKSVSWRCVGTLDTIIISFLVTGKLNMAISIGSVEVFSKILLYYVHERVWERVSMKKKNEYSRT